MKIPGFVWWIVIPTILAAIIPVVSQFYPTNEVFWSALFVAIGGAVISAIAAVRQTTQVQAQPQPPAGAQGMVELGNPPPAKQRGFMSKWLLG